ncbi:MAG TPA: DNA-processing protein DprA [Acidimicrobiales bacterium]
MRADASTDRAPEPVSPDGPSAADCPDDAFAVALATLTLGPARLARLVEQYGPRHAWQRVLDGDEVVPAHVRHAARRVDVADLWASHLEAGVGICVRGSGSYPEAFEHDPDPPAVLFHRGDLDVLSGPRVAIVGTRRCTRYGIDVARELGEGLSAAGVSVVSGLALGIDAAAHHGALAAEAPPIGVVGSGLDVIYPRANRNLWSSVGERGVLLTEVPLGGLPLAWRFPARNRLIAALADVVVVVESHTRGGSLSTVAEAVKRDRPVMAVPGPVRSPASAGANQLLADGAAPACGVDDVLVALGLSPGLRRASVERRPTPDADGQAVLDAIGWQPASVDQLALRTGMAITRLVVVLERLREQRWVAGRGGWYERVGRDRATSSS